MPQSHTPRFPAHPYFTTKLSTMLALCQPWCQLLSNATVPDRARSKSRSSRYQTEAQATRPRPGPLGQLHHACVWPCKLRAFANLLVWLCILAFDCVICTSPRSAPPKSKPPRAAPLLAPRAGRSDHGALRAGVHRRRARTITAVRASSQAMSTALAGVIPECSVYAAIEGSTIVGGTSGDVSCSASLTTSSAWPRICDIVARASLPLASCF